MCATHLPVLLQKRDEEVDGKHRVGDELVIGHLDVADGDTEAENLLQLELDRRANLGDLVSEVLSVGDGAVKKSQVSSSSEGERCQTLTWGTFRPWRVRDRADGGSA